jgi:acetyl-CoA carboxylase biotin carboxylase subunit
VARAEDLPGALRLARGEARTAFGDDRVYLERWVDDPRHVEIQIVGDSHGAVVHLGERECSIQRRHQKLLEESPSPALDSHLRKAMGAAAVAAARAVGFTSAGTVEFLVDGPRFYFLEINARLQVEHPVTELVTGVDLVGLQLQIASGAPLPFRQEGVAVRGHAIECRISAEDPTAQFLPWSGRVGDVILPGGPGVRVDGALGPGVEVTRHYDPLLAKVIAWGETRREAIARMAAALSEMVVTGVPTTLPFHRWALRHPAFVAGRYSTRFVDAEWAERAAGDPELAAVAAAVLAYRHDRHAPVLPAQPAGLWRAAARREALS